MGRSCDRPLDTEFSLVFLSSSKCWDGSQAPCFSCWSPDLNWSNLSSLAIKATKITFPNYTWALIQTIKTSRPLSRATASNHPNVFTSTLPLLDGRTGEVWEASDKMWLFSHYSSLYLLFYYISLHASASWWCRWLGFIRREGKASHNALYSIIITVHTLQFVKTLCTLPNSRALAVHLQRDRTEVTIGVPWHPKIVYPA
jgi:hypothetical protein